MLSLRFAAHSEVGRVRKNNQDAGYASPSMLLVCDGMGGAAAGDLASAVASSEAARSDHRAADGEEMLERIAGMIARANSKLTDLIDEDPELDGMGTTFCGAMFSGEQFGLAHLGDSRGYLLRDGTLRQLTHDHSWVQSLIDEGKLTPEQAATHPHRSLILKVLNGQAEFDPDLEVIDAQLGDRIMFCSDGLSGLVETEELQRLLSQENLDEAVAQLAETANANGGFDNITIVLGEVVAHDPQLDQVPGELVGSATEVSIPRTGQLSLDRGTSESGYPTPPAGGYVDPDQLDPEEAVRYAPQAPKRRWPGILALCLTVALVLGGSAFALFSYARSRYFIGDSDGYVAIYSGLNGSLAGFPLHTLEERTDIYVKDLPKFHRTSVKEARIDSRSLTTAQKTAQELRTLAEHCAAIRRSHSPLPPAIPTAPASAPPTANLPPLPTISGSPSSTVPDPEAC